MPKDVVLLIVVSLLALTGIPAFICVFISNQTAKKRKEQIFEFATEHGFLFNPGPTEAHIPLSGFVPFDQGREERSRNHLSGKLDEIEWDIFDYEFVTGYGKRKTTDHWSIVAARIDIILPLMNMRPPRFMDKVAGLVGLEEITFQPEEFNSIYKARCKDHSACHELIHPKMMQHLCSGEPRDWQIRGTRILIVQMGHASLEQTLRDMEQIKGFVKLIPTNLRAKSIAA